MYHMHQKMAVLDHELLQLYLFLGMLRLCGGKCVMGGWALGTTRTSGPSLWKHSGGPPPPQTLTLTLVSVAPWDHPEIGV